jgi:hypothetical protein
MLQSNYKERNVTKHLIAKEKDMIKRTILGILVVLTACGSNTPAEPPVAAAEASGNTSALDAEPPTEPTEAGSITLTEPSEEPAAEPVAEASGSTPTEAFVEPTAEPPVEAGDTVSTLDEDYPDSVPVFMQLVVGTMMLEETGNEVTAEQAQELLPLWQMFRAIRRGDAPPSLEEIAAITDQIIQVMTPEQLGVIQGMRLVQDDVRAFTLDNNIPQGTGSGGSGGGGMSPGGGGMGSGGGNQSLSPEEQRERMIIGGGKSLVDELIRRLEIWAG